MFASDIGMSQIEEINIVRNGENYGWMRREGYWENGRWRGGLLNDLFPLPENVLNGREKDGLTYPVAIFDHDEGRAVTGGFAYHGRIAAMTTVELPARSATWREDTPQNVRRDAS